MFLTQHLIWRHNKEPLSSPDNARAARDNNHVITAHVLLMKDIMNPSAHTLIKILRRYSLHQHSTFREI